MTSSAIERRRAASSTRSASTVEPRRPPPPAAGVRSTSGVVTARRRAPDGARAVRLPRRRGVAGLGRALDPSDRLRAAAGLAWTRQSCSPVSAVMTVTVGAGLAWLVTAFDFPGRRLLDGCLLLPLAVPTYIVAYAYLDVLHPVGPVQETPAVDARIRGTERFPASGHSFDGGVHRWCWASCSTPMSTCRRGRCSRCSRRACSRPGARSG